MKTILLLTDFSQTAMHAASFLQVMAHQIKAEKILIYHSCETFSQEMIMITDVLVPMPNDERQILTDARSSLERIKSDLEGALSDNVQVDVLMDKRPVITAVEEMTSDMDIALIVLGICGINDQGKNSVGKTPAMLMKHHQFPLLIIPSSAPLAPITRIMLACELKDIEERLPVEALHKIIQAFDASLYIVNVDKENAIGAAGFIKEQTALHRLLGDLDPKFFYPENKDIVSGLLEFSTEHQIDLIIAVPKHSGFLEGLFHESATRKLAVRAIKPLLLIHRQ